MTDLFTPEADNAPITFDSLVGEGKKYKDPDTAAKSLIDKDNFIEQLKAEAAELRTELRSRTNLEEIVETMRKPQESRPQSEPNREISPTPRQEPNLETNPNTIDLKAEVAKLLKEETSKIGRENNIQTARQGLKERFGADYNQTLKSIAADLGVSEQFLTDMASVSPTGLLKLVDSTRAPDDKRPVTPPQSRDRGPTPSASGRKNKAYYDELRRTDINAYLSPRVQNELYREAMSQGDRFYE